MTQKDPSTKNNPRVTRAWSIAATGSMLTLFASTSVHAADGTTLGIPSWIFVVLAVIILGVVCLLPTLKKKTAKPTISKDLLKPTPQKPQAPAAQQPVAKKADVAPAPVAPTPVAKVEPVVAPTPAPEPAPAPAPLDAMVEAKQFLDQNRIPQAVGVLSKGLQREPERTDLMLELLTIYSKQNHHEAFDELFEQLAKLDDPLALIQAEELRDQLEPLPEPEDDRGIIEYQKAHPPVAEPEVEVAPTAEAEHDTLAFTLDEIAEKQPEAPAAQAEEFDLAEFDNDLSFELDKVETITPAAQDNAMDFTLSEDLVAPAPVAPTPEPLRDLEFKLPEAVVEPAPAAVEAKKEDSGLVDLEFDLDDSFALDDGQTAQETAKSQSWTTDLDSEDFAPSAKAPAPAPVVEAAITAVPAAIPASANDPLLSSLDEEFPFLSDIDPQQTCLELAKSYISLSETDSARELLDQVIELGTATQQTEARALIAKLAS